MPVPAVELGRPQTPGTLNVTPQHLAVLEQRDESGLANFLRLFLGPRRNARLHGPDENSLPQHKAVLSFGGEIEVGLSSNSLDALLTALCVPGGEQPQAALIRQHQIRAQLARGDVVALRYSP